MRGISRGASKVKLPHYTTSWVRRAHSLQSSRPGMSSTTDYEAWQHKDLVQRVHELEQKLKSQTLSLTQHTKPPRHEFYKKEKKEPKPFDPTKYHTRKIALKFAYLGANYNGFEHHANNTTPMPTIEEVLWRALIKTRLIFPEHKPGQSKEEVCWDGCDYSKCGRTDKGVSAFGQVIALNVRSARPMQKEVQSGDEDTVVQVDFDPIKDELPYIQILNRVLPPEVRILAWCPSITPDFSARFNCKERRYRYFFTNPAFLPWPGAAVTSEGWLDIEAMKMAAKRYQGQHDFRNFCKIDPSKQITNFERRIFHAGIHAVGEEHESAAPKLYYFEVRGSAFLWHQVRHLIAVLFLVGQRLEEASIVDKLFDIEQLPGKPLYEMASDVPLVLWDCIFPETTSKVSDHTSLEYQHGHHDSMEWIYAGDEVGGRDLTKKSAASSDGRYGSGGIMEDLWSLWRERKMHEVLASQLMSVVAGQGDDGVVCASQNTHLRRLFDGSSEPRNIGPYTPILQRSRQETPDVVNARYAARKAFVKNNQE